MIAAKLAGRCADGNERGQGSRIHALTDEHVPNYWTAYGTALCGQKEGRRSVGWTPMPTYEVTCPRCLKKLERMNVSVDVVTDVTNKSCEEVRIK